jgi:hypothetical protein
MIKNKKGLNYVNFENKLLKILGEILDLKRNSLISPRQVGQLWQSLETSSLIQLPQNECLQDNETVSFSDNESIHTGQSSEVNRSESGDSILIEYLGLESM